ncbi:MAG: hypothetical protein RIQ68_1980 [Pseudomonadota bacterium]
MTYRIPLAYNNFGPDELAAIQKTVDTGMLTQGRQVEAFEKALAEWSGASYAIFVNSGSSANMIGIEAIVYLSRMKPELTYGALSAGDEIITPGLSWPTTLKPLLNHGLRPVFCDVDLKTLNATVADLEKVRTKRTRGVVAVPVLGNPEGLDEIRAWCSANGLVMFEDSCESFGAITGGGKNVGRVGMASAFSFYFSHHISTIEGGVVLTDSAEIADLCYALRSHGWTRHFKLHRFEQDKNLRGIDPRFCFVLPGYNVRATEINAAIGLEQLKRVPDFLARRRRIARGRIAGLMGLSDKVLVPGADIADRHSWMTFPLLFASAELRQSAQKAIEEGGVETRPIIVGNVLRHPLVQWLDLSTSQPDLPNCDAVFERGMMIGLNPMSTDEEESFIIDVLRGSVERA